MATTEKSKTAKVLRELDAFQAATDHMGTASDPVVHQYLSSLSQLVNRLREILRKP